MKAKSSKSYALLLADIQKDYLQSFSLKLSYIETLTQNSQWESLKSEWHKLKGNGQTIGFKSISQVSEIMEQNCLSPLPDPSICLMGLALLKQLNQDHLLHLDLELTRPSEWLTLKDRIKSL